MRISGVRGIDMWAAIAVIAMFVSTSSSEAADGKRYAVLVGVENYLHPHSASPPPSSTRWTTRRRWGPCSKSAAMK